MSRLIDADSLEREGWTLQRTYQKDENTMIYEVKKPSEMPTIEPKKGKWLCSDDMYESGICSVCKWDTGEPYDNCKKWFKFCPNCGSYNGGDNNG